MKSVEDSCWIEIGTWLSVVDEYSIRSSDSKSYLLGPGNEGIDNNFSWGIGDNDLASLGFSICELRAKCPHINILLYQPNNIPIPSIPITILHFNI